jgi:hypothetical protein
MLTIQTLIDAKYPINKPLTDKLVKKLLDENKDKNYSYITLFKEFLVHYPNPTPKQLLNGYSGLTLFKV